MDCPIILIPLAITIWIPAYPALPSEELYKLFHHLKKVYDFALINVKPQGRAGVGANCRNMIQRAFP